MATKNSTLTILTSYWDIVKQRALLVNYLLDNSQLYYHFFIFGSKHAAAVPSKNQATHPPPKPHHRQTNEGKTKDFLTISQKDVS